MAQFDRTLGFQIGAIRVPHPLLTRYLAQHNYQALAQRAGWLSRVTPPHQHVLKAQYHRVQVTAQQANGTKVAIIFQITHLGQAGHQPPR